MKVVIATKWSYPFGGGEEFMYQSGLWLTSIGYDVYWISFLNSKNEPHPQFQVKDLHGIVHIDVTGGFNLEVYRVWLNYLQPDLIHHQGSYAFQFAEVAHQMGIPFVTGLHFWHSAIEMGKSGNYKMLENIDQHVPEPNFYKLSQMATIYAASPFVQEVVAAVTGFKVRHIITPVPSASTCVSKIHTPQYITMINIHQNKGGEYLLKMMENCPELPFYAISTEHQSESLDEKIRKLCDERPPL